MTYAVNGRQYVAIAAGGPRPNITATPKALTPEADMADGSNAIYVFALPQN
jgi:hypothetical protein